VQFEHFALNVPDPCAMAAWYVTHCGMSIAKAMDEVPFTHFLADSGGRVVIEIYRNETALIAEYPAQHPLVFHLALAVEKPKAIRDRLLAAGATLFEEAILDDGSHLVMLRDPWGIPLQLCCRTTPFV